MRRYRRDTTLVMSGSQLSAYGWPDDHPFNLDRHGAFERAMATLDFGNAVTFESAPPAGLEELKRFHSRDYLEFVVRRCEEDRGFLDGGDTPARRGLFEAARHVVGAALYATEGIMQGRVSNAFLPIGGLHHAGREHAAGFCVLSDIGVVIETLRSVHGVERIAYVDIDVHHGDGVYYAYEEDPHLFFADIHEDGRWQYPGTGSEDERGRGPGRGSKINLCLNPGDGDSRFLTAFEKVEAHVRNSAPEFILLQCGADGLRGDPLGGLNYSANAHAHATQRLCALARSACRGRILAMGGGGYSRENLASAWTAVVRNLVEGR